MHRSMGILPGNPRRLLRGSFSGALPVPFVDPSMSKKNRKKRTIYKRAQEPFVVCVDKLGIVEANGAFPETGRS